MITVEFNPKREAVLTYISNMVIERQSHMAQKSIESTKLQNEMDGRTIFDNRSRQETGLLLANLEEEIRLTRLDVDQLNGVLKLIESDDSPTYTVKVQL